MPFLVFSLKRNDEPLATPLNKLPVAAGLAPCSLMSRQARNDDLATGTQTIYRGLQARQLAARCENRAGFGNLVDTPGEQAQIQAEAGRRPATAETLADAVVAATQRDRPGTPSA